MLLPKMKTLLLPSDNRINLIIAGIIALAIHGVFLAWLMTKNNIYQWDEVLPAASVIVEFSFDHQAKKQIEPHIGPEQQLSALMTAQEAMRETPQWLLLAENEQADIQVQPKKSPQQQQKPIISAVPTPKNIPAQRPSDNTQASRAQFTSDAIAQTVSDKTAASYQSESHEVNNEEQQWQARVLGHLIKFKQYPADAHRRNRSGTPVVSFVVDAEGYVLQQSLLRSSGTRALDREAERVIKRAQPLPIPPPEALAHGQVTVILPIVFLLNE